MASDEILIQSLLFVLNKRSSENPYEIGKKIRGFVLIPSTTVEEHLNVCQLFTRNNVEILSNIECPLFQKALELDQVEVLELVVSSSLNKDVFTFTSKTTPFIPACIETGNEELVRQLFGKDAGVYKNYLKPSQLHKTVDEGNSEIIERLLALRADIKVRDLLGGTMLHFATRRENETLVKLLLKQGAKVNIQCKDGSTALHFAAKIGNSTIASSLLEKGALVNARKKDGSTCLLLAAEKGQFVLVTVLLKNGANVNIGNHDGVMPLHVAAKKGHAETVKVLLEQDANVNATVTYRHAKGVTPLCLAVEKGHLTVVKSLLESGADIHIPCYDGQTVLKLAVDRQYVEIVECLLKHGPDLNNKINKRAYGEAVLKEGDASYKIAEALMRYGFTFNVEDSDYTELLHNAVSKHYYAAAEQLLKLGANVNKVHCYYDEVRKCFRSTMPLFTAIRFEASDDIIKLLISYGADVHAKLKLKDRATLVEEVTHIYHMSAGKILLAENVKLFDDFDDLEQESILSMAISDGDPSFVEEVLSKGAKVEGRSVEGRTPLHLAAEMFSSDAFGVLLKYGASIDSIDCCGETALHIISADEFADVEYLVQRNADVEARNFSGRTPIFKAAISNNLEALVELSKYGASIGVIDDSGLSPFHYAVCGGHDKIYEALLHFHFTDTLIIQKTNIYYQLSSKSYLESLRNLGKNNYVYSHYARSKRNFRNFTVALAQHMIKVKAAFPSQDVFDFCSEENLLSVERGDYLMPLLKSSGGEWLDFKESCEIEVAYLKTENIGATSISYYDILTADLQVLSCYLRNRLISRALISKDYETKFQIYAKVLSYQFEKGWFRRELLNKSLKCCYLLVQDFDRLPFDLKEEILSYLTNRDLEVLVYACKCISDCS